MYLYRHWCIQLREELIDRLIEATNESSYAFMDIVEALVDVTGVPEQLTNRALYESTHYLLLLTKALYFADESNGEDNEDVEYVYIALLSLKRSEQNNERIPFVM